MEIIQNLELREVYETEVVKIKSKLGKEPEIELLWHGTYRRSPKLIYDGYFGFDMKFSDVGMWGIAIYFARNAKYSNDFCYTLPNGEKQLILAEVFLGDYTILPANN